MHCFETPFLRGSRGKATVDFSTFEMVLSGIRKRIDLHMRVYTLMLSISFEHDLLRESTNVWKTKYNWRNKDANY